MSLLVLIGIFICPILTLGCILVHYDHEILGAIAIIVSLIDAWFEEVDKPKQG